MIKAVIFDIDGVLIDTLEGNARYLSHVIQKFGGEPISTKEYARFYSWPAKKVYMHFLPHRTEEEMAEIRRYASSVAHRFFRYSKLNPHATEALKALKGTCRLGIVTSRKTVEILNYFKIMKYFGMIVEYSDTANHKPDPEPILLALKRLKVRPEEAVYVGDAASDAGACRAAGVKVIIYRNPKVKGDFNIRDFREIPGIVEKLNGKN